MNEPGHPGRGETGRIAEIVQLSLVQLLSGLAIGLWLIDRRNYPDFNSLLVAAGPVASAALLSAALLYSVPTLLPGGRLSLPANFTLPILFVLLVRVSAILWTSPQSAAFRTADPLLPALLWTRLAALGAVAGVECALLTVWVMLRLAAVPRIVCPPA